MPSTFPLPGLAVPRPLPLTLSVFTCVGIQVTHPPDQLLACDVFVRVVRPLHSFLSAPVPSNDQAVNLPAYHLAVGHTSHQGNAVPCDTGTPGDALVSFYSACALQTVSLV